MGHGDPAEDEIAEYDRFRRALSDPERSLKTRRVLLLRTQTFRPPRPRARASVIVVGVNLSSHPVIAGRGEAATRASSGHPNTVQVAGTCLCFAFGGWATADRRDGRFISAPSPCSMRVHAGPVARDAEQCLGACRAQPLGPSAASHAALRADHRSADLQPGCGPLSPFPAAVAYRLRRNRNPAAHGSCRRKAV